MEAFDPTKKYSDMVQSVFTANLKRFCYQSRIPAFEYLGTGEAINLTTHVDHMTRDLVVTLAHDVYSMGECTRTFTLEAEFIEPATWLDAFRDRFKAWIPNWILKRWRYTTKVLRKSVSHTVDAMALLPHVPIMIDRKPVQFCLMESKS